MQNDEMIWNVINKHFCSFKRSTDKEDLCSNEYNVTGKCNRVSCPLANSNYGTVIEHQGKLMLCLKTVERAHLPRKLWEKIKLSTNVPEAKRTIEQHMEHIYPKHQIERCKRRLIRLKHMLDRMRKLELKPKEKLEGIKKKTERREATREKKALVAAHLEDVIEDELLKRLHQGVYGSLYDNLRVSASAVESSQQDEAEQQEQAAKKGNIRFEAADEASSDEVSESDGESDWGSIGSELDSGIGSESEEDEYDLEDLGEDTHGSLSEGKKDAASLMSLPRGLKRKVTGEVPLRNKPSQRTDGKKVKSGEDLKAVVPVAAIAKHKAKRKGPIRIAYESDGSRLEAA